MVSISLQSQLTPDLRVALCNSFEEEFFKLDSGRAVREMET